MRRTLPLLIFVLLSGCFPRLNSEWYASGIQMGGASGSFIETRRGVRIAYGSSPGDFLPGWTTDNLYLDEGEWRVKESDEYVMVTLFDVDDDGVEDLARRDLLYDLRLIHDATGGMIWVRTVAVSTVLGRRDLDVILFDYLDDIRSDVFRGLAIDKQTSHLITTTRLDDNPVHVSGMQGHAATIDIIDTERTRVDPNAREGRARFIITRTPYTDSGTTDGAAGPFPVVMLIGYWNRADRYEAGLADFDALVQRITMQGSPAPTVYDGILPPAAATPTPAPVSPEI